MFVVCCWLLAISCMLLFLVSSLLRVHCWFCMSFVARGLTSVVFFCVRWLSVVVYGFAACCLLCVDGCLLSVVCWLRYS